MDPTISKFFVIIFKQHKTPFLHTTLFTWKTAAPKKKKIMKAIERYDAVTCVRFKPRTNEKDYVEYYGVGGCSSHIGKVGGKQQVAFVRKCVKVWN